MASAVRGAFGVRRWAYVGVSRASVVTRGVVRRGAFPLRLLRVSCFFRCGLRLTLVVAGVLRLFHGVAARGLCQ